MKKILIVFLFANIFFKLFAQTPQLTTSLPTEDLAGNQVCFDLTLTNTGDPGYNPYIRLILPAELQFDSATYMSMGVTVTNVGTFSSSNGNVLTDPKTNTQVNGPEGGSFYLLEPPIGTLVENGPLVIITVCVTIDSNAQINSPLEVIAQPVYELGDSPTGENGPIEGTALTQSDGSYITPQLWRFTKLIITHEQESVPGPDFPFTVSLTLDVADGKTVNNVVIRDNLPTEFQYIGNLNIAGGTNAVVNQEPDTNSPGGTLEIQFDSVIGGTSTQDVAITFDCYLRDVLEHSTCDDKIITNTATVDGEFPTGTVLAQLSSDGILNGHHIEVQKSVSPSDVSPGDTVTYSFDFQVSDYETATSLVLTDTIPDGIEFNSHQSLIINGTSYSITPIVTNNADGTTTVVYDIHSVTGDLPSGTTGTLSYTANVLQTYHDGSYVLANDTLTGDVFITYSVQGGATDCEETSSASVSIQPITIEKTIINPQAEYYPGDTVRFKLTMTIPSGDAQNVVFKDFFPLPVFDITTVDTTWGNDIKFASDDTWGQQPDSITVSAPQNLIQLEWNDVHTDPTQSVTISVEIDIKIVDKPFDDNLKLTNIFEANAENSANVATTDLTPTPITVRAPKLVITKGVDAASNSSAIINPPSSQLPVDGDVEGVDAGDTITFVITVENQGGAPAYHVVITDPSVSGLINAQIISVKDGNGNDLDYRDPNDVDPPDSPTLPIPTDLTNGIRLDNPLDANDGSLGAPYGSDTAIIVYQVTVDSNVDTEQVISNLANVVWSSQEGADSYPAVQDDSTVTVAIPSLTKTVESITPGPNTSINSDYVTTGDTVIYNLRITLPEGNISGLSVYDHLPAGLEYQSYSIDISSFGGTIDTSPTLTIAGDVSTGQELTFAFDGVNPTVVNDDNDETNNFFDIKITCLVKDVVQNSGYPSPQLKTNTARVYSDNLSSTVSSSANLYFTEPHITVNKTMSPSTGLEAGDTVTITIQVQNDGTGKAFDVQVSDTLNQYGDIFDLTTVTEGSTPSNYTFNYTSPTVTYTMNSGSLDPGNTDTFTFTVQVKDDAIVGSTYRNDAVANGDNQSGTTGEERSYSITDSANADTKQPAIVKDIISTSESFTSNPYVAIGEVITYRITVNIPEGTTQASSIPLITDNFPSTFQYLTGSATYYAVYDDNMQSANLGTLPTVQTPISPTVNGNTLEFDFGTITNSDNDSNNEQIIIEYKMLVLNVAGNNRGSNYINTGYINYSNADGNPQSLSDSETVTVAEPDLSVTKTASPQTIDGGTITYTVVADNNSSTASTYAWEPVFTDNLPSELTNVQITSAVLSRGNQDISASAFVSGNTVTVDLSSLPASERYLAPGDNIQVVYTAEVTSDANFEQNITNTAEIEATSLPGDNGTANATPGTPGSDTGERIGDGSTNTSGDAVNDLNASGSSTVSVAQPTISKTGGVDLQIGDKTQNTITVSIPVGNTTNFVITDDLPNGLAYTGQPITINIPTGVSVTNNPNTTPGAGTDPLVFDFGDVTNDSGSSQTITIIYEVQATNILTNQNGTLLTNTASLTYDGSSGAITSSTTSRIIEPNLEITSQITSGAVGSDAGDTVTYEITVTNTDSNATAYNVDLTTILPPELLGANPVFFNITLSNPDNIQKISGGSLTDSDYTITTTSNTNDTLQWELFNLPPNTSITITFSVQIVDDATAGETLTVNTQASYTSEQNAGSETRDGSEGGNDDDNSVLNNYNESALSDLTLNSSIAIQKSLSPGQSGSGFTIGDIIQFDLRVDVVEGTIPNVQVIDTLPDGLSFVQLVSIIAGNNISYNGSGNAVENAGQITVDLGDITNTANGDNTDDYLIVRLEVQVDDVQSNTSGTVLTNQAEVTSDSGNAGPVSLDITITEPNLEITKTASDDTPPLGKEITFTITVQHSSSTADAYDVQVSDVIPSGMTYIAGSTTGQAIVDESDLSNPVFDLGTITLAENSKTFQFKVKINEDWIPGNSITNTVNLSYDGQAGDPSVQRSYSGSGNETVTPTANSFIDATKTVELVDDADSSGTVTSGDTLEYTITLQNNDGDLTGVVFVDEIPSDLSYVAGSLTSTAGSVDDSNPAILVVNVGDMASNDTVTVSFRATVSGGLAEGTVISNQGYVESDQTIREFTDEDGIDSNGDQPTDVVVGGQNSDYALYVWKFVELLEDNDNSGSITAGDTMRYYFVFYNDGNQPLTGVSLDDTIPAGLTIVAGSEYASSGTVSVSGSNITLNGMTIAVDDNEYVSVDVVIDQPLYDSDGDSATETFTNQGVADSNETDSVLTDANGDSSDGYQPTVFVAGDGSPAEPVIDVEKRWQLTGDNDGDGIVDPGDTIEYSIYIYNNGSVDAENVRLTDTIPSDTSIVSGSVVTSNGVVVSENPVDVNVTTLQAGDIAVITFKVVIDSGVSDGTVISNQATVNGDNFTSQLSDDNGNDSDGINPTLTSVSTTASSGGNYPYGLEKDIISTSNPDTSGNNVAIEEEVTFRIQFSVPSGTVNEVSLVDTLPSGLSYIAGSARLARIFDTGLTSSQNPGDINNASSGNFVNLVDGSDIDINGNQLTVYFGDVTDSDNDSNDEGYILEFRAVVDNVETNRQGTILTNTATLNYKDALGQAQSLPEVNASVSVVEPDIVINKEAVSGGVGSSHGDTIRFRITIRNLSGDAFAYNINLSDVLPHEFMGAPDGSGSGQAFSNIEVRTSNGVVVTATGNPVDETNVLISTTVESGDTISVEPFTLPSSGYLELLFDVVVHNDADLGSYITNVANATYTSLPLGGRDGSDGQVNDYIESGEITLQLCANLHIYATVENGTIEPADTLVCDPNASYKINFKPNEGYHLSELIIDGVPQCFCKCQTTYTFSGISRDHTIHVVFVKDENPVINSFKASVLSGVAPLRVDFTVEAYDPDGGDIKEYRWDFNNDGIVDLTTFIPSANHLFALAGEYTVTVEAVDTEDASTKSFPLTINVNNANPVVLSGGIVGNSDSLTGGEVWAVNYNPSPAIVDISVIFSDGNIQNDGQIEIPPYGKVKINSQTTLNEGDRLSVNSNQRLIFYTEKATEEESAVCYLGLNYGSILVIPHIAEEKDFWDTILYASLINRDSILIKANGIESEFGKDYSFAVNLNSFVSEGTAVSSSWGFVQTSQTSPFGENNLTGFIEFKKKAVDGAFVELANNGYKTCIFPHIPVEKELFWTGFVVDNLESFEQSIKFTFYNKDGNVVGEKELQIEAKSKFKGLFSEIFPEIYGSASWCRVEGEGEFVCAEIFGVFPQSEKSVEGGAICGMLVSSFTHKEQLLPFISSNEEYWTGIAIANPNDSQTNVTLELVGADGAVLQVKEIIIKPFGQYKEVVGNVFNKAKSVEGYIKVLSSNPVSACEIGGNYSYTTMKAITGTR